MTIQAIWYQSACRAWKRTFWERSLYSSQTSRAPKGIRPTSATSTLKWAIMDQVRSSCALIVPAEAPAWPSETCSRSPPRLGSCCIFSPSVPVSVFACIQEYGHRHDSPKRDADVSPKWVIFRCFPAAAICHDARVTIEYRLDVMGVTQTIVTAEKRSGPTDDTRMVACAVACAGVA